ncbi:hypothetical protein [Actinopolyspora halophila]|uniref:hypothetical protein n=1 Tax=Actinopolyspora halophila TaxID=1850 RepID=UPI00036A0CB5|nr:hypothetical protein [Actinopolyspora halophila]
MWLRPGPGDVAGPLALVLTIVAAALSWRFIERPVMRRSRRPHRQPTGTTTG